MVAPPENQAPNGEGQQDSDPGHGDEGQNPENAGAERESAGDGRENGANPEQELKREVDDIAGEVRGVTDEAKGVAGDARYLVSEAGHLLGHAREIGEQAGERALALTEAGKNTVAYYIESVAAAGHAGGGELDQRGMPWLASVLHRLSDGCDAFSHRLERRPAADLVDEVSDFARRRPALFAGAAVLAGVAVARFLSSSAERHHGGPGERPGTGEDAGREAHG